MQFTIISLIKGALSPTKRTTGSALSKGKELLAARRKKALHKEIKRRREQ